MISILNRTVTRRVKELALEAGFHAVGITRFEIPREAEERFFEWRKKGYAAGMKFLAGYEERRDAFLKEAEWAKSVIVLGVNYYQPDQNKQPGCSGYGKVARYAWGDDYHKVIRSRHAKLIDRLQTEINPDAKFLSSIDTRPVFEREMAQRAGIGFIGKQNQLLSLEFGPWLFLSELTTDLELEPDVPHTGSCGTCRLCIDVCPTQAIVGPRELDAGKCIAYQTIENPGKIPDEIAGKMKDWFFGCDECLTVCPYTAKQKETEWPEFKAQEGQDPQWIDMKSILAVQSNGEMRRKFAHSAMSRINRKQAQRNAEIVLRNNK